MTNIIKWEEYDKMSNVEVLKHFDLRNICDRRVLRRTAEIIAVAFDCGATKVTLCANGTEWIAPRWHKGEKCAGYLSRLHAWINDFVVHSMDRNWDGDILGIPENYKIEVIVK